MLSRGLHEDTTHLFDDHHSLHLLTTVIITNNFKGLFAVFNIQLCNNNHSSCCRRMKFHRLSLHTTETTSAL